MPSRSRTQRAVDQIEHFLGLLGVFASALGFFFQAVDALFQAVEIGQHQLGLDRLDVGDRIDLALDVGDVAILEAAHHVDDGVDLADGGEKLVAEPLAFRGAAHQPGDIDEGDAGRDDLLGLRRARRACRDADPGTAISPTLGSMVQNG